MYYKKNVHRMRLFTLVLFLFTTFTNTQLMTLHNNKNSWSKEVLYQSRAMAGTFMSVFLGNTALSIACNLDITQACNDLDPMIGLGVGCVLCYQFSSMIYASHQKEKITNEINFLKNNGFACKRSLENYKMITN